MEGFAGRVSADAAQRGQVDSPFDFERNMRIYVAGDAPAPETGRLDLEWLADMVGHCALAVRGGSLVLFTSYRDMRAVAAALEEKFAAADAPLPARGR
jgi:ATP-dependent DNA helicase DinG